MSETQIEKSEAIEAEGEIANEEDDSEDPEIEEDLFEEELRIDGICGVY